MATNFEEYFKPDSDRKILYVAIPVPREAKEEILELLKDKIPNKDEDPSLTIYTHHSTIEFLGGKTGRELELAYPGLLPLIGHDIELLVTHYGTYDEKVGAVKCKVFMDGKHFDSLRKDGAAQHITIWTAKGGKPVQSNKIDVWTPLEKQLTFMGKAKPFYANDSDK
jgi:hypothetical protein